MCCSGPTWKREVVPDHKFDFVDTREFTDNGCGMRFKYLFLYLIILKSFLVYVSDIFTAVTMLSTDSWSNDIYDKCPKEDPNGCIPIDFVIGKWVFFGCIIFGFLLLAYEARKSKRIIASRDISYAFTNILANNYYSLRSYDHFCFFDHISNSTKRKDDFAFFVFFAFKDWKRLILSDGPRQSINAITLYSFYLSCQKPNDPNDSWDNFSKYFTGRDLISNMLICVMIFTVLVFACSLLLLVAAAICYVPLLCYVQGNLKEYCCHKVDKRIAEIIRRRNRQRQQKAAALARKEAAGDYSHLKNKKGEIAGAPLPQPTLPNVALDDDELSDGASFRTRTTTAKPAPGAYTPPALGPGGGAPQDAYGYPPDAKYTPSEYGGTGEYGGVGDYPPMPTYPYGHGYPGGGPPDYSNPSIVYGEREPYFSNPAPPSAYGDEYGSTSHLPLTHAMAPPAGTPDYALRPPAGRPPSDPLDVGAGRGAYARESDGSEGLAYDGPQDYPSPTSAGPPPRGQEQYYQQQQSHYQPQQQQQAPWDDRAQQYGHEQYGHGGGGGGGGFAH